MKSCIYQKQEPVDIPQIGNPDAQGRAGTSLGFRDLQPADPLEPAGLAAAADAALRAATRCWWSGLGPAGFTLAHHLMNDGHTVVGIDGLKIEPLPADLSGVLPMGAQGAFPPDPPHQGPVGPSGRPHHGGLRRRRRVRHHGALGQELPEGDPPAAGTAAAVRHVRRRQVRRHDERRGCVRCRVRPHRAVHGGGASDCHPDEERSGARACGRRPTS